jgi:hypothetical protein
VFLCVEGDVRLVEVAISAEDVGVGVLAGANYVVYLLYVFVCCVFPIKAEFHDEEAIPVPIRFVIVIERGIVNECMSGRKVCGGFFFSGMAEGLPHTRLYKCLVNAFVAGAAFVHTHIVCRGIVNIAPEGSGLRFIIIAFLLRAVAIEYGQCYGEQSNDKQYFAQYAGGHRSKNNGICLK